VTEARDDGTPADGGGAKDHAFEDILIPVIPSLITTLVLEGSKDLSGSQKIGAGASLGLVLWVLMWHRRGGRLRVSATWRKRWVVALVTLNLLALVALVVTVIRFNRPTPTTATLTLIALGLLGTGAVLGSRISGAAAAAVTGGLLGLCLGIAL
jgi:hypothetical protein